VLIPAIPALPRLRVQRLVGFLAALGEPRPFSFRPLSSSYAAALLACASAARLNLAFIKAIRMLSRCDICSHGSASPVPLRGIAAGRAV
jgi:hypothetical protein